MAFTLIELIVSITILSVIMLSVFEIYSNILQINKRLEVMRTVQENVRNITEQIASDIREKWIDFAYYDWFSPEKTNNYTGNGNILLAIKWGDKYYPMKDSISGPILCSEMDQKDMKIHCYIGKENSSGIRKAISNESVRIENIRFFLSGNTGESSVTNLSQEWKATIVFSLGIENKVGVSSEIAKNTHMSIETTISEKVYKKN